MRLSIALTLLLAVGFASRAATAAPSTPPPSLIPCPYTPEEIEAELGITVSPGEASDVELQPTGRDVGCIYTKVGGSTEVVIRQVWDPGSNSNAASAMTVKNGRPVPGDPDGAETTRGGGRDGGHRVELHYHRGRVQVLLAVDGRSFTEDDMEPKIVRLRRVPPNHP
jgi:hypothetical protein